MFEYGNLRFIEQQQQEDSEETQADWFFITGSDVEKIEIEGFIQILNYVGKEGWELIQLEPEVGYLFKRKVVKSE